MPIESRSRMISFRLTSDEYNSFRQLCLARGLRNVSEMVRAAVNQMLSESVPAPDPHLETRVLHLENRLDSLSTAVERLGQDPALRRDHSNDHHKYLQAISPRS